MKSSGFDCYESGGALYCCWIEKYDENEGNLLKKNDGKILHTCREPKADHEWKLAVLKQKQNSYGKSI